MNKTRTKHTSKTMNKRHVVEYTCTTLTGLYRGQGNCTKNSEQKSEEQDATKKIGAKKY